MDLLTNIWISVNFSPYLFSQVDHMDFAIIKSKRVRNLLIAIIFQ